MSGTIPCNGEGLKTEARASLIFSLASLMQFTGIPREALLTSRTFIRSSTSWVQMPLNMKLFVKERLINLVGSVRVGGI